MPRPVNQPSSEPVFHEPAFNEQGDVLPDPNHFLGPNVTDGTIYKRPGVTAALKKDVVSFDKSRAADGDVYPLAEAFGSQGGKFVKNLTNAGKIIFHCLGDTGATQEGMKYRNELTVTELISSQSKGTDPVQCPAFMYHLGDVVYDFGEKEYYYDQFYDAFRNYTRPIFAIPGNHDSFVVPGSTGETPLDVFCRNFCSPKVVITPEAKSLHRTAVTQPGVYFTLDAPFVRIIGLFSNSLEDPGVISSANGWTGVPDYQINYLSAQLAKIRDEKYPGAVIIALHHPPFSYQVQKDGQKQNEGTHGGNAGVLRQIDSLCAKAGVYPHAVLSGHAHNYQRYTRTIAFKSGAADYQVPFIVCGNSGHNVQPLVANDHAHKLDPKRGANVSYLDPDPAVKSKKLTIDYFDDYNYGFLTVIVDNKQLAITYTPTSKQGPVQGGVKPDTVIVDLATHQLSSG